MLAIYRRIVALPYNFMFFTNFLPKENRFKNNRAIGLLITLFLASCTYAPKTTKIDNTYNARQMAVGMGDQPTGAMSSTIHEDEIPIGSQVSQPTEATGANGQTPDTSTGMPLARLEQMRQQRISGVDSGRNTAINRAVVEEYITIGSTKADVARIQGTPRRVDNSFITIDIETWWYGGYDRIEFKNGRVNEWNNSSGFLKVKMY